MAGPAAPHPRIAIVLKGWPRLSETFIAQEIAGLEARGLAGCIVSLRKPTDAKRHRLHDLVRAPVRYLPEYLHEEPWRVLRAWLRARRLPGYATAWARFRTDFRRDRTRNRLRRFGQALVLAAELPAEYRLLYAHFLHTPCSVARYAAHMRDLPFAVSAHAKDIWTTPDWDKADKLAECRFAVTCSRAAVGELARLAPPERVALVYHGLDLARFPEPGARPPGPPFRLLCVARAVEKKGLPTLLDALALLPETLDWHLTHVGSGPDAAALKARAQDLGIAARITWAGSMAQDGVIAQYQAAHAFVLASVIAADGDRDGLPNVLMEAQALALPCVATAVSAIPELILDEETGLLVPPGEPDTLAEAILRLATDPALCDRLGRAGRIRVAGQFGADAGLDRIAAKLGLH
ncbi:glycosyltransferase family 4 protein [Zavarzinia sp. CC-PAN008]|uniref:glycosyltransferase family 4 protein n=1 Tax=Zavarzinia sp. CC-PAN008 TaxID=3243332 RepID=UPI003F747850